MNLRYRVELSQAERDELKALSRQDAAGGALIAAQHPIRL
jgi:hypothetical protein